MALAASQGPGPRYLGVALACAGFLERVETDVRVQGRGAAQAETAWREGLIRFRGRPEGGLLRFEAWYDSLRLWRDSPVGRLAPDTDGLLGGRWRGWLGGTGGVQLEARPFIPPAVRDVADLADALADFFPPLPPVPLAAGARWSDSTGLEIRRLADSVAAGRPLARYAWRLDAADAGDTLVTLAERIVDRGALAWDNALGPVAWSRELVVESQIRGRPPTGEPLRSRVAQRISVRRVTDAVPCP